MKLLFLSFYYEPDLCAGSFRATALVKALKNFKDLEITVITTLPNRYASFSADAQELECQENITIHRIALPPHKSGMLDQATAFSHFYRSAMAIAKTQHFDAVFGTSSRLFTAFLTARIARRKNLPYYLDIRDIFVDTMEDLLPSRLMFFARPALKRIEHYSFSKASTINLVSGGFKSYFENRFPNIRYQWHTNGIDDEFLLALKQNEFIQPNKPSNSEVKTILYAGNIGDGQGLHDIVPQMASALGPEYRFLIIGDGGRKCALENAVKGLNNVELHKPIARKQLIQEYQKADILFLHLNDCEAFEKVLPSKLFEYAAMGKPVLAGVAGFAAEFVSKEISNSAVFEPKNLAGALESVKKLKLTNQERKTFIDTYARNSISTSLAEDIFRACAKPLKPF